MKNSIRWFNKNAEQSTRKNFESTKVISMMGPHCQSQVSQYEIEKVNNEKYFIVGDSEIGGEEVVG
jgi:hypothetical protein